MRCPGSDHGPAAWALRTTARRGQQRPELVRSICVSREPWVYPPCGCLEVVMAARVGRRVLRCPTQFTIRHSTFGPSADGAPEPQRERQQDVRQRRPTSAGADRAAAVTGLDLRRLLGVAVVGNAVVVQIE